MDGWLDRWVSEWTTALLSVASSGPAQTTLHVEGVQGAEGDGGHRKKEGTRWVSKKVWTLTSR